MSSSYQKLEEHLRLAERAFYLAQIQGAPQSTQDRLEVRVDTLATALRQLATAECLRFQRSAVA